MDLAERVRALEDERDVLRTLYAYSYALDYEREDEFLECFTATATWTVAPARPWAGFEARTYAGREALRRFFREHIDGGSRSHKHLLVEPRVALDGDTARVESYYVRIDEDGEAPYLFSMGRYSDVLIRCDDGRWRLAQRQAYREAWTRERSVGPSTR